MKYFASSKICMSYNVGFGRPVFLRFFQRAPLPSAPPYWRGLNALFRRRTSERAHAASRPIGPIDRPTTRRRRRRARFANFGPGLPNGWTDRRGRTTQQIINLAFSVFLLLHPYLLWFDAKRAELKSFCSLAKAQQACHLRAIFANFLWKLPSYPKLGKRGPLCLFV